MRRKMEPEQPGAEPEQPGGQSQSCQGAEPEQVQLGAGLCSSGFTPSAALNTGRGFPTRGRSQENSEVVGLNAPSGSKASVNI